MGLSSIKMYYIYILKSRGAGGQYVGMTKNPEDRLQSHNDGFVKSTKSGRPWEKIYQEACASRIEARKREKYLKSAAGRRFRKKLIV